MTHLLAIAHEILPLAGALALWLAWMGLFVWADVAWRAW